MQRTVVGSTAAHVSRNFFVDGNGHAYVPRLSINAMGRLTVELVQYGVDLKPVGATPLAHYLGAGTPGSNHGITSFTYLDDGRIVFATHIGHLYLVQPRAEGAAMVTALGPLHPKGESYAAALFALSGKGLLAGIARRDTEFEWVIYDADNRIASPQRFDTLGLRDVLVYGSVTRDDAGRFYVGGWTRKKSERGQRPLVLQITAP